MRDTHRPSLVATLVLSALVLDVSTAVACRCKEPSAKVAFRSADSAVLGKVVAAEREAAEGIAYRVQVGEQWKDPVEASITVHSSTTCRFDAEVGERYVLFLKRSSEGTLETATCMGNLAEHKAGRLLKFLRGTKPHSKN